jgi:hypothetical protein
MEVPIMTDAGLFIGYGVVYPGRERQALSVYGELIQYLTGLQQRGAIEGFDAVQLQPHGGDLGGFLLAKGTAEQVAQIQASEEFQRLTNRALLVVGSLGIVNAAINEGVQRNFADWNAQLDELAGS